MLQWKMLLTVYVGGLCRMAIHIAIGSKVNSAYQI